MRLYWLPFYPAAQLVADGPPKLVRLLGEDLIAWRDTEGRPSLVQNACPHRGAPLLYARNEECGLRCVYHGWKFDHEGRTLDTPAEPLRSRLKDKVRLKHYPVRERHGVLWAYMGDEANPPPLPEIEFNLVPESHCHLSWRVQECNWLQALEGEIDSAHAAILHGRIDNKGEINQWTQATDLRPVFECQKQPYGVAVASRRKAVAGQHYWRVNQFLLPFWTLVPPHEKFPELSGHAWVPIDDNTTLCLMFSYTPAREFWPRTRELMVEGHRGRETGHASRHAFAPKPPSTPYADFWTKFTPESGYQFDYALQQSTYFSGLPGLWVQDAACQSGVAPIYDRSQENLGANDQGIVQTRRLLLDSVAAMAEGTLPVSATVPETFMVRAVSLHLPESASWVQDGARFMQAKLGEDLGYDP
jgi:phenylpropionate dioxygenase-like ring-hydroxylating dioxygenase large terminal subunit